MHISSGHESVCTSETSPHMGMSDLKGLTVKLKLGIAGGKKNLHFCSVCTENVYISSMNNVTVFGLLQIIRCLELLMCICSLFTQNQK